MTVVSEHHFLTMMEDPSSLSSSSSMDVVEHNAMTDVDMNAKQQVREVRQPFPVKVYEMLDEADPKGFAHIVSWNSKGSGFMVYNKDQFTKLIVPHYFNQTKYKSFQRQLSLYGFQRVTGGHDKGLRYHEKLRRGERDLVRQMKPVGYRPRGTGKISDLSISGVSESETAGTSQMIAHTAEAVPIMTVSGTTSPTTVALTAEQPEFMISAKGVQDDTSMVTTNSTDKSDQNTDEMAGLPTVVSSNSLDRHGQEQTVKDQHQELGENHPMSQGQVHLISPGQSPDHFQNGVHSEDESCLSKERKLEEKAYQEFQTGLFEGLTFYLMPPSQELVKEMIPTPCLVNLPPYVVAAFASTTDFPPHPVESDAQMKEGLEVGFNQFRSMEPSPTKHGATTCSTTAALLPSLTTDAPPTSMLPPSPKLLLDHCVDALDFHAIDVTMRTV